MKSGTEGRGASYAELVANMRHRSRRLHAARAIQEANDLPGDEEILLSGWAIHACHSRAAPRTPQRAVTWIILPPDVITIRGAGANVTVIDGNGIDRVFDIVGQAILSGVTIEHGDSDTTRELAIRKHRKPHAH